MFNSLISRFATHTYYCEPKVKTESKPKTHQENVIHKMMQHLKTAVSGGKEKLSHLLKDIKAKKEEFFNKDLKTNNNVNAKKEIKITGPVTTGVAPGQEEVSAESMRLLYANFSLTDIKDNHFILFSEQMKTGEFTNGVCRGLTTSLESVATKGMKHDKTLTEALDKLNHLRFEKNIIINDKLTNFNDLGDRITAGTANGKAAGTEVTDPQSRQNIQNTMTQIMDIIGSIKEFA
ncbi:hypothetical protein QNN88_10085 [Citrobacter sp. ANG330]|uniref:hypothetical protein n=1 Tax=Citrobacter sp. ANG330 TaxID=3048142 RepID=UPI0039C2DE41